MTTQEIEEIAKSNYQYKIEHDGEIALFFILIIGLTIGFKKVFK
jgi:hypothetical protein